MMKSKEDLLGEYFENPANEERILVETWIDLREAILMQNAKLEQISKAVLGIVNKK